MTFCHYTIFCTYLCSVKFEIKTITKMTENMKKIINVATPAVCAVALVLSVAAFTKTNAATTSSPTPVVASAPAGQPVDLTYAAEKSLPSVVYIKSVQNSKVQTVEYSDPFEDFFSDPFGGFFGRGQGQGNNGRRQRQGGQEGAHGDPQ